MNNFPTPTHYFFSMFKKRLMLMNNNNRKKTKYMVYLWLWMPTTSFHLFVR